MPISINHQFLHLAIFHVSQHCLHYMCLCLHYLLHILCGIFDPGGYWWPLAYSTWTPTIVSFNFLVSFIVAQFTMFGSFGVLNFRSCFEALNDVFSASNGQENRSPFRTPCLSIYRCSP